MNLELKGKRSMLLPCLTARWSSKLENLSRIPECLWLGSDVTVVLLPASTISLFGWWYVSEWPCSSFRVRARGPCSFFAISYFIWASRLIGIASVLAHVGASTSVVASGSEPIIVIRLLFRKNSLRLLKLFLARFWAMNFDIVRFSCMLFIYLFVFVKLNVHVYLRRRWWRRVICKGNPLEFRFFLNNGLRTLSTLKQFLLVITVWWEKELHRTTEACLKIGCHSLQCRMNLFSLPIMVHNNHIIFEPF